MTKILNVAYLDQSNIAPTGCESVSAVMLLHYLGINISIEKFIDQYLPKAPYEFHDGQWWGPDPRQAFVGNPYDAQSMGCYAPVIKQALRAVLGETYTVVDETKTPMETLLQRYIDIGMPVLVWATIDMMPFIEGPSWRIHGSGEIFTWRSNEHCLLLVGYDEANYYCLDPWQNKGLVPYDRALLEMRHQQQYEMAVGVKKSIFNETVR